VAFTEIVETDYEMRTGQFVAGPKGPERVAAKWAEAANIVNALGPAQKTGQEWKVVRKLKILIALKAGFV